MMMIFKPEKSFEVENKNGLRTFKRISKHQFSLVFFRSWETFIFVVAFKSKSSKKNKN